MLQVSKLKTVGRVVSMVLLLAAMMGPWLADSHPATKETCLPPLVWLGDGYCACLITFMAFMEDLVLGLSDAWFFCLPPLLPILSTVLLLSMGERRWLWICHLAAWGLAAVCALLWSVGLWYLHHGRLVLWGAGLGGAVAVALLVWEILMHRRAKAGSPVDA